MLTNLRDFFPDKFAEDQIVGHQELHEYIYDIDFDDKILKSEKGLKETQIRGSQNSMPVEALVVPLIDIAGPKSKLLERMVKYRDQRDAW